MFGIKSLYSKKILLILAVILSLLACSTEETPTLEPQVQITEAINSAPIPVATADNTAPALAGSWVGKIDGTNTFIAISSNGKQLIVFICDGKQTFEWLEGQASNVFTLARGNGSFVLNLTPESAYGSIIGGGNYNFQAAPASGEAGLYRLEETLNGEVWTSGWIMLNDGRIFGLRVSANGDFTALSDITPGAIKLDANMLLY